MIFKKYELKIKTILLKNNNKILTKFFQKPIRNMSLYFNISFLSTNESLFENKIKFNYTKINPIIFLKTTNLQKKKII
jgi:hypothetical protein